MKKIKVLSILLALCMVMSASVGVYADNDAAKSNEVETIKISKDAVEPTVDETIVITDKSAQGSKVEDIASTVIKVEADKTETKAETKAEITVPAEPKQEITETKAEEVIEIAEPEEKIFEDVSRASHSWAIEAIESMAEMGLIKGYSDGTFKPDKTVSKLEALSLVARVLGVQDKANEPIIEKAVEMYGETVDQYELNFGSNEVCYLLIKNIITLEELGDYIDKSNVSVGMKRYEVAVLLTKALDANSEVSKNLATNLTFADANDIPAYAKKYVEYITTSGMMSGVGDNRFSPNTDVTRAQAAILMKKLLEMTNYTFKNGVVAEYDNSSRIIRIKAEDEILKYTVNANVKLRFEGTDITVNDISGGHEAVITFKDNGLYAIDFIAPLVDKEVKGVISSTSTGKKPSVSFFVIGEDDVEVNSNNKETYPISSEIVVSYNDEPSSLQALKSGTFVNIVVSQGEITAIRAYDKTNTVSGRVTGIELTPVCRMTVELADGSEVSYIVSSDVEVSKNGSKKTAADVVSGDSVSITTTYERITKIVASSKQQTKSGIIHEVIISATPKIVVKTTDGNITYNITNNCLLDLPGITSPTFFDLRVGVAVDLTVEGDTVVKLSSNISEGVTQVTGVVSSVNASYGVIQVTFVDAATGISVTEPVFVKAKATIIDILTGSSLKLNAIKTGAKITAFGMRNSGVFEATTVNVTNN